MLEEISVSYSPHHLIVMIEGETQCVSRILSLQSHNALFPPRGHVLSDPAPWGPLDE